MEGFVEFAFFYFAFSVAVAMLASKKGRSAFSWFLLSVVLSPLLAVIFLLVNKDMKEEKALQELQKTHVKCPDCAELVKAEASVCKHCGCKLIPNYHKTS